MTNLVPDNEEHNDKAGLQHVIRSEGRAVLVVNTLSRRGQHLYGEAKRLLAQHGMILDAAYPVRDPSRLPEIVRDAVAMGHNFIIVGGGDGTISSVVDHLAYKKVVLGILPLGTANSFARTLSIPLDLAGAVDVLVDGKVVDIDLGQVNDDLFANAAAIGLPASIARSMPHGLKRTLGRAGYLLVAGARLLRYRPFRCTLSYDGRSTSYDALEIRIANGSYQGGVLVAEEASVESRDLVIHVIRGPSKWTLAKAWLRHGMGSPLDSVDLEILRTTDVVIDADPRQYVSIDGEAVTQTPIRATVAREALHVIVPTDRADLL